LRKDRQKRRKEGEGGQVCGQQCVCGRCVARREGEVGWLSGKAWDRKVGAWKKGHRVVGQGVGGSSGAGREWVGHVWWARVVVSNGKNGKVWQGGELEVWCVEGVVMCAVAGRYVQKRKCVGICVVGMCAWSVYKKYV